MEPQRISNNKPGTSDYQNNQVYQDGVRLGEEVAQTIRETGNSFVLFMTIYALPDMPRDKVTGFCSVIGEAVCGGNTN